MLKRIGFFLYFICFFHTISAWQVVEDGVDEKGRQQWRLDIADKGVAVGEDKEMWQHIDAFLFKHVDKKDKDEALLGLKKCEFVYKGAMTRKKLEGFLESLSHLKFLKKVKIEPYNPANKIIKEIFQTFDSAKFDLPYLEILVLRDLGIQEVSRFEFPHLRYLDISSNPLLPDFGAFKLPALETLVFTVCKKFKNTPFFAVKGFKGMPLLKKLDLHHEHMSSFHVEEGELENLETLKLVVKHFKNFDFLLKLQALKDLQLYNQYSHPEPLALPEGFGNLKLDRLSIRRMKVRNVNAITSIATLEYLALSKCGLKKIEGDFFAPNLKYLDLSDNEFETVPAFVETAGNLQTLKLDGNKLKALPAAMSDLKGLRKLDVRDNALFGLPTSLLGLSVAEGGDLAELYIDDKVRLIDVEGQNEVGQNQLKAVFGDALKVEHDNCRHGLRRDPYYLGLMNAAQKAFYGRFIEALSNPYHDVRMRCVEKFLQEMSTKERPIEGVQSFQQKFSEMHRRITKGHYKALEEIIAVAITSGHFNEEQVNAFFSLHDFRNFINQRVDPPMFAPLGAAEAAARAAAEAAQTATQVAAEAEMLRKKILINQIEAFEALKYAEMAWMFDAATFQGLCSEDVVFAFKWAAYERGVLQALKENLETLENNYKKLFSQPISAGYYGNADKRRALALEISQGKGDVEAQTQRVLACHRNAEDLFWRGKTPEWLIGLYNQRVLRFDLDGLRKLRIAKVPENAMPYENVLALWNRALEKVTFEDATAPHYFSIQMIDGAYGTRLESYEAWQALLQKTDRAPEEDQQLRDFEAAYHEDLRVLSVKNMPAFIAKVEHKMRSLWGVLREDEREAWIVENEAVRADYRHKIIFVLQKICEDENPVNILAQFIKGIIYCPTGQQGALDTLVNGFLADVQSDAEAVENVMGRVIAKAKEQIFDRFFQFSGYQQGQHIKGVIKQTLHPLFGFSNFVNIGDALPEGVSINLAQNLNFYFKMLNRRIVPIFLDNMHYWHDEETREKPIKAYELIYWLINEKGSLVFDPETNTYKGSEKYFDQPLCEDEETGFFNHVRLTEKGAVAVLEDLGVVIDRSDIQKRLRVEEGGEGSEGDDDVKRRRVSKGEGVKAAMQG